MLAVQLLCGNSVYMSVCLSVCRTVYIMPDYEKCTVSYLQECSIRTCNAFGGGTNYRAPAVRKGVRGSGARQCCILLLLLLLLLLLTYLLTFLHT